MGWISIPDEAGYRGTGGPGLLLESLIGVDVNNRDGPDTGIWELKYHSGSAPITLFHLSPNPRGIMHDVVRGYGWPNDRGQTSFRHTLWGKSNRGFYVFNDEETQRIVIRKNGEENNPNAPEAYWEHDKLINAFVYKLRRLALVKGRKKREQVKYESVVLYSDPNTTGLIKAIASGKIAIDFDARTNTGARGLRDHGTKFRIKSGDLKDLYSKRQFLD